MTSAAGVATSSNEKHGGGGGGGGQDMEFLNLLRAADVPLTHLLDWPAVTDAKAARWPGDLPGGGSGSTNSSGHPAFAGIGASLGLDLSSDGRGGW
jgi:hypothetical protein